MFATGLGMVAISIVLLLIVVYRTFAIRFIRFLVDQPFQAFILALFFALIYGQVGTSLGLPLQFWSEEPSTRLFAALSSTLLLAIIGINGFYLVPEARFHYLMDEIFRFLNEKYYIDVNWQDGQRPAAPPDQPRLGVDHPGPTREIAPAVSTTSTPWYRRVVRGLSRIAFLDIEWLEPKAPIN